MDEEPELFSGDPGLDLDDGELLTGELAVEDFVDDDVDAILVFSRNISISRIAATFSSELKSFEFDSFKIDDDSTDQ